MLEASAGGMDRRNQILRRNWSWNRPVGMCSGRRGARRENVRKPPKRGASTRESGHENSQCHIQTPNAVPESGQRAAAVVLGRWLFVARRGTAIAVPSAKVGAFEVAFL